MPLLEILAVIAILSIVLALAFGVISTGCGRFNQAGQAKDAMTAYTQELIGVPPKGVTCMQVDTDGDGYVSCTASYVENGETKTLAADCAVKGVLTFNRGCKPKVLAVPQR